MTEDTAADNLDDMDEMDSILDATLDDLEDLPEFKPFPPGQHQAMASMELKVVNSTQCVELTLKGIGTVDLTHPERDKEIEEGHEASCLFMLNNEFGRGNFKKVSIPLAEKLGTRKNREIIEGCKDIEVVVLTKYAKNKSDPDSPYMNVVEMLCV